MAAKPQKMYLKSDHTSKNSQKQQNCYVQVSFSPNFIQPTTLSPQLKSSILSSIIRACNHLIPKSLPLRAVRKDVRRIFRPDFVPISGKRLQRCLVQVFVKNILNHFGPKLLIEQFLENKLVMKIYIFGIFWLRTEKNGPFTNVSFSFSPIFY